MIPEKVILVLEIIGTISFAVSGAFVAIGACLDIFGVIFIGCITAIGGGIVRDVLIGISPPSVFSDFSIFIIAAVSSVIVFAAVFRNKEKFDILNEKITYINNFFDAVGLAAFSVMGTETAFTEGFADNAFLSVVLGMLTGIGGGIFRDILTRTTPYVFKKHIYAVASILGSCLYYILRKYFDNVIIASVTAMLSVIIIRLLAAKYRWSLPKIRLEDKER